jgi:hypothetical protein
VNADYRKGWRAACAAVAANLRNDSPAYDNADPNVGELLRDLADEIEATPPPRTMVVVDEAGKRLL